MRIKKTAILPAVVATLVASPLWAGNWDGTIKVGGIVIDEEGDLSTVQETYNIHDGFSLTQIRLSGGPDPNHYLRLDLREINLDGRQGDFLYRKPGMFRLKASFDQHRQVFDPHRAVTSERKDWKLGARITPVKWLSVSGDYNNLKREGDRLSFPVGTESALGTGYDYTLHSGGIGLEARKNRRGAAVKYRVSEFTDDRNTDADRTGQVLSARVYAPCLLYDKLTHLFRAAYGISDLPNRDLDYTLKKFQYTGVVRPVRQFQFKYDFDAQRIDNESTNLQTDRFQNIVDATYFHDAGSVFAGYGYEMNDDDRRLTSYHSWRAGTTVRSDTYVAKFRYSGRVKRDDEDLTLLKDSEASRLRADFEIRPVPGFDLGLGFNVRDREFPDIGVESEGRAIRSHGGYSYGGWGRLSGTYTFTEDRYRDRAGSYDVNNHVVTGRVDLERIKDLRLSSGLTYMEAREDLDIEKSILFFEGVYTVRDNLHFEVKYNIFNYDDFILRDRYYTANVVWFNVAYDLHRE